MRATLLKALGYGSAFLVVFVLSFYWTFPWDRVRDRLASMASERLDMDVRIAEVSPWRLTGLELLGVEVRPKDEADTAPAKPDETSGPGQPGEGDAASGGGGGPGAKGPAKTPPIRVDRLAARLAVIPLLVGTWEASIVAEAFDGEIHGTVGLERATGTRSVDLTIEELALGKVSAFRRLLGMSVSGSLAGEVQLTIDGEDFSASTGRLALNLKEVVAGKGQIPLPKGSMFPFFEFESPTALGQFDIEVNVGDTKAPEQRSALAKVVKFEQAGADLSVKMTGDITLKQRLMFSRPNLALEVTPAQGFIQRNSLTAVLQSRQFKKHQKDGAIGVHLGGTFSRLSPRLQKPGSGAAKRAKRRGRKAGKG